MTSSGTKVTIATVEVTLRSSRDPDRVSVWDDDGGDAHSNHGSSQDMLSWLRSVENRCRDDEDLRNAGSSLRCDPSAWSTPDAPSDGHRRRIARAFRSVPSPSSPSPPTRSGEPSRLWPSCWCHCSALRTDHTSDPLPCPSGPAMVFRTRTRTRHRLQRRHRKNDEPIDDHDADVGPEPSGSDSEQGPALLRERGEARSDGGSQGAAFGRARSGDR